MKKKIIIFVFTSVNHLIGDLALLYESLEIEGNAFKQPLLWLKPNEPKYLKKEEIGELDFGIILVDENQIKMEDFEKYNKEVLDKAKVFVWFHSTFQKLSFLEKIKNERKKQSSHFSGIYQDLLNYYKRKITLDEIIKKHYSSEESKLAHLIKKVNEIIERDGDEKEIMEIKKTMDKIQEEYLENDKNK